MVKTEYTIKGTVDMTIAVAADLHEHDPSSVISVLKAVQPDIIIVPGDLMERHEHGDNLDKYDKSLASRIICFGIHLVERITCVKKRSKNTAAENAYIFLREANKIAPVVYSLGNHELFLTEKDKNVIAKTGTVLLDNSSMVIGRVVIGGIPSKQQTDTLNHCFLQEFVEKHADNKKIKYKILLCHHPEYYQEIASYADLIISGHCHGGQIRIGGSHGRRGQGVFAPGQGLMPKYHHGLYKENGGGTMVVSSGCANTSFIPRLGNPCEVVVVNIKWSNK